MNVAELYLQTAQLGFETTLEDSDRFYFAANRALLQVCKVRPAIRHCLINHKPLANLIRQDTFSPIEKIEDITYEAEGAKAYYFEADGNGVLYLEEYIMDTGEWRIFGEIPLQSKQIFVPYRGFIKKQGAFVSGRIRLRFAGEYRKTLYTRGGTKDEQGSKIHHSRKRASSQNVARRPRGRSLRGKESEMHGADVVSLEKAVRRHAGEFAEQVKPSAYSTPERTHQRGAGIHTKAL